MPLVKRAVFPVNISQVNVPQDVTNDLEFIFNASLCNLMRQLSSLSIQATDMFNDLGNEVNSICQRTGKLNNRLTRMQGNLDTVIRLSMEQSVDATENISMVNSYTSRSETRLQTVDRSTIPNCVVVVYKDCEAPPPLHIMNQFRVDGKDSAKLYSDPTFFFELWRKEMLEVQPKVKKVGRNQSKAKRGPKKSRQTTTVRPIAEEDSANNQLSVVTNKPVNNVHRRESGGSLSTPSGSVHRQSPSGGDEAARTPDGHNYNQMANVRGGYQYPTSQGEVVPPSPSQLPPPPPIHDPVNQHGVSQYIFDDSSPYGPGLAHLPPPNFTPSNAAGHGVPSYHNDFLPPPSPPSMPSNTMIPPPPPPPASLPTVILPPLGGIKRSENPPPAAPSTRNALTQPGDLLESIRQGIILRKVEDAQASNTVGRSDHDTVYKVMEELEKRRQHLRPNESDEENSDWSSD